MMLWKCCTQYASKFGKLSSGHRTGKCQFSFQSLSKAMPKNAQTTTRLHSSHTLVMLKILQAKLQQYMNHEFPDVQAGFGKGRGTRDQIANIRQIIKKSKRIPEKHLLMLYWLCQSLWLCGSPQTVENSPRDGNTKSPNLPLEKSVCRSGNNRTGHGTTDWFQIRKGVCQGCILSPCLFNLYAEYIMRNAGLDEAQAGIKIARRNTNNLSCADNTTLMAENEELKSILMKVKEKNKKVGLKLNIQKTKIMTSGPITSWQIDEEAVGTVTDFILRGLQNHCKWWLQPWS